MFLHQTHRMNLDLSKLTKEVELPVSSQQCKANACTSIRSIFSPYDPTMGLYNMIGNCRG